MLLLDALVIAAQVIDSVIVEGTVLERAGSRS